MRTRVAICVGLLACLSAMSAGCGADESTTKKPGTEVPFADRPVSDCWAWRVASRIGPVQLRPGEKRPSSELVTGGVCRVAGEKHQYRLSFIPQLDDCGLRPSRIVVPLPGTRPVVTVAPVEPRSSGKCLIVGQVHAATAVVFVDTKDRMAIRISYLDPERSASVDSQRAAVQLQIIASAISDCTEQSGSKAYAPPNTCLELSELARFDREIDHVRPGTVVKRTSDGYIIEAPFQHNGKRMAYVETHRTDGTVIDDTIDK